MIKVFGPLQSCRLWLYRVTIIALGCLWLIGCSGGISGTGDGGPIVVVDNTPSDSADSSGIATETNTATLPAIFDHQYFPRQLTTQFSSALTNARDLNQRIPDLVTIPVTQKISNQLFNAKQFSVQVQVDIANIEDHLLASPALCHSADPCNTVTSTITASLSPTMIEYQQSLQPELTRVEGDQISYSDVSYTRETDGYFDQQLLYTDQSGTKVLLQWTADNQLISLVAQGNVFTTYLLSDLRQSTTTLRTENTTTGTVLHAVLKGTVDTTIEADWHADQQHYVRATADATSVILYAIDPTDSSVMRTRESFDLLTNNYLIETCSPDSAVCDNWQTVISNVDVIDPQLAATETTLGDFSLSMSSSLQVSVSAQVDEFVIATGSGTEQPAALSLVCGGQRVLGTVRSYCWQPLPLDGTPHFYEEVSGNGSLEYRRLPDAKIQ